METALEQLDRQLQALSPLAELSGRLTGLEDEHGKLTNLGISVGTLSSHVDRLDDAAKSIAASASQISALSCLQKPPFLQDTRKISEWIDAAEHRLNEAEWNLARGLALESLKRAPEQHRTDRLTQLCNDIREASRCKSSEQRRVVVLARLESPPKPHDLVALKSVIDNIQESLNRQTQCHDRSAVLTSLEQPPSLHDTDDLKRTISQIADANKVHSRLETQSKLFLRLMPPTEPANLRPLKDSIDRIDNAARAQSQCLADSQKINIQIEQFRREIQEWVKKNPRCNACGQPVTADLITSGGHHHE